MEPILSADEEHELRRNGLDPVPSAIRVGDTLTRTLPDGRTEIGKVRTLGPNVKVAVGGEGGPLHLWDSRDASIRPAPTGRPQPDRVKMLKEGISYTSGDRDDEYGDPGQNMACAGELKAIFRKFCRRPITAAEQEALDMVMTKLSRLACGKPKRDTYVDGAVYFSIAGEVAFR
jgi:hypothetical protein